MVMQSEDNKGLRRLFNALRWTVRGMKSTFKHEEAFRQEVYLVLVLLPVGLWLGEGGVEKALLTAPLLIVLVVELMNSAIESVVDRISTDHHKLSGRAKDQGSAAVFVSLSLVALCWVLVLLF